MCVCVCVDGVRDTESHERPSGVLVSSPLTLQELLSDASIIDVREKDVPLRDESHLDASPSPFLPVLLTLGRFSTRSHTRGRIDFVS